MEQNALEREYAEVLVVAGHGMVHQQKRKKYVSYCRYCIPTKLFDMYVTSLQGFYQLVYSTQEPCQTFQGLLSLSQNFNER
jgi:hypothetical protein